MKKTGGDQMYIMPAFPSVDLSQPGNLTLGKNPMPRYSNAEGDAPADQPKTFSDTEVTILGKKYTIAEIVTFVMSLLVVGFALAFPLENPLKDKK